MTKQKRFVVPRTVVESLIADYNASASFKNRRPCSVWLPTFQQHYHNDLVVLPGNELIDYQEINKVVIGGHIGYVIVYGKQSNTLTPLRR